MEEIRKPKRLNEKSPASPVSIDTAEYVDLEEHIEKREGNFVGEKKLGGTFQSCEWLCSVVPAEAYQLLF